MDEQKPMGVNPVVEESLLETEASEGRRRPWGWLRVEVSRALEW
jgi:hypothetical protein